MTIKISNYRAPSRNLTSWSHWRRYQSQRQEASEMVLAALGKKVKPFDFPVVVKIKAIYKNRPIDTPNIDDKIWTDCLKDVGVLKDDNISYLTEVSKQSILSFENAVRIIIYPSEKKDI